MLKRLSQIGILAENLCISGGAALLVWRIAHELLHNPIQHVGASETTVWLAQYPDRLQMKFTDDRRAFLPTRT